MKNLLSKIKPYLTFSKKGLFSALLIGGVLFTLYHKQPAQAFIGDDPAEGALIGGVTGATIGGIAGGGKGAAIGGIAGAGLGAAMGATRSRYRDEDGDRELNRLYSKRDFLREKIQNTESETRRARYQRQLDRVQADINSYEGPEQYRR
jgi:hypothetical protein